MSGISSGVGLISGLPTAELISQLMLIEARPLGFLQNRVSAIQAERTAFADLSARLLALKSAVTGFDEPDFFKVFRATSSHPNVLTATVGKEATLGSFVFTVHSLVSSHQLISQGFTDADTTPLGTGTISLEVGQGLLNPATDLEALNGGEGVRRGKIEITDRDGDSAEIDLTAALTVQDVLEAINSQTAIDVRARVSGDRIVLEDLNETAVGGSLTVRDLGGRHAAEDLGIAQSATAAAGEALSIEGNDVINLVDSALLSMLRDGNGIGRAVTGADFTIQRTVGDTFKFDISLSGNIDGHTHLNVLNNGNGVRLGVVHITTRDGTSAEVDLSGATNLQDVVDAIGASGLDVGVTFFNSSSKHALQLKDNTTGPPTGEDQEAPVFRIEDVSGFAARDLGMAAEAEDGSIIGNGIHRVTTIGDVMRAVRYAYDEQAGEYNNGRVLADFSANGNGLVLGSTGTPRDFEVIAGADSTAAADLGIVGSYVNGIPPDGAHHDLIAGLNTVMLRSLHGGAGLTTGVVRFSDRASGAVEIDFTGAQTVQDLVDLINREAAAGGARLLASVNPVGNGLIIRDESGATANPLEIADVTGTMAADLGIAGSYDADQAGSGNLQLQYISEQTLLADLNNGRGVRTGQFRITDGNGQVHAVKVTESQKTVGDILRLINAAGENITASINATGDGILITDSSGGVAGPLKIEDQDGFAAKDLNIVGQAQEGETAIDGSFEVHIQVDADDTLQDVVEKINQAGADFSAAAINDGSDISPYRLVVNSQVSGVRGRLILDGGTTGLGMETLAEARDAVVFFGGSDAENPLVLRSSSNTLSDVIEGVTLNLQNPSDEPVDLAVTQDLDTIVDHINGFVEAYNEVIDRIDELTSFDSETLSRGVLFADSTVAQVENRLFRSVTGAFENTSTAVSRLSSIGISGSAGGHLSFDQDKFREVYAESPEAVEQLFTTEETGFGDVFEEVLDDLTDSIDGLIPSKDSALEKQEEMLRDRMEHMQELLDLKQARMERQFAGLESALAILQGQQTALTSLQTLAFGL